MQEPQNKLAFFLPNSFTALNIACGFASILFMLQGQTYKACFVLLLGAIFDSVDGRVARMTGTSSPFGEQFDSMSDLISFGIAPALVYYNHFLLDFGRIGKIAAFLYVLCGALRLARFNANIEKVPSEFFQGIPIPGAAMALIGLMLFSLKPPPLVGPILMNVFSSAPFVIGFIVVFAALMISNIPFPSFKNSAWIKDHKKQVLVVIFLIFSLLLLI